jgi:hypothetical protein
VIRRACLGLLLLAGCGAPAPGAVTGEAFLVEDLGREVDLGSLRIGLVPEEEQLDSTLARVCPSRSGPPADAAAAQARAWSARERILRPRVSARATADAKAHFEFDSVAAGRYRLWADTTVDSVRWTWLQPVTVRPGDTVRVELSNANPDENPFRCGPRDSGPTPMTVKGR